MTSRIVSNSVSKHLFFNFRILFDTFSSANGTDTLGNPLIIPDRAEQVWMQLSKHIQCIQDVIGVALYTEHYRRVTINGVELPVYRCGRGTTSLESFHLHLQRFIPGNAQ